MRDLDTIVVDTNVLVAALRSRNGASHLLVRNIGMGQFTTAVSTALVLEYESVLAGQAHLLGFSKKELEGFIDYIVSVSLLVPISFRWRPFLRDPADECILELAVAANAKNIVTYNKRDFVGVTERFGIRVLDGREFLILTGGMQ